MAKGKSKPKKQMKVSKKAVKMDMKTDKMYKMSGKKGC